MRGSKEELLSYGHGDGAGYETIRVVIWRDIGEDATRPSIADNETVHVAIRDRI